MYEEDGSNTFEEYSIDHVPSFRIYEEGNQITHPHDDQMQFISHRKMVQFITEFLHDWQQRAYQNPA